jgi:hypothetical protein
MKTITKSCLIITGFFLLTLGTHAQTYSIGWDVIAGGGGTTTGGVYSVSSTVGQQVAGGALVGGTYSLSSGFWSLYAVSTPGAPALSILLPDPHTVVVAWSASATGWTLQQNINLVSGTWITLTNTVNIVNGQNQIVLSPTIGEHFFRLKNP